MGLEPSPVAGCSLIQGGRLKLTQSRGSRGLLSVGRRGRSAHQPSSPSTNRTVHRAAFHPLPSPFPSHSIPLPTLWCRHPRFYLRAALRTSSPFPRLLFTIGWVPVPGLGSRGSFAMRAGSAAVLPFRFAPNGNTAAVPSVQMAKELRGPDPPTGISNKKNRRLWRFRAI